MGGEGRHQEAFIGEIRHCDPQRRLYNIITETTCDDRQDSVLVEQTGGWDREGRKAVWGGGCRRGVDVCGW